MSAPIIQAEYEQLEEISQRFKKQSANIQQLTRSIQHSFSVLIGGDWEGRGIAKFDAEMTDLVFPALNRLSDALEQSGIVTHEIIELLQTAEEEASSPFQGGQSESLLDGQKGITALEDSNISQTSQDGFIGNALAIARGIVDAVDKINDLLPIPAAVVLASVLRNGSTYPGQILVRAPQWIKHLGISARKLRKFGGVGETLSHIKGANMAHHIARGARKISAIGWVISGAQALTSVASTWHQNWDEYNSMSTPERVSAISVDAGLAILPVATEVAGGIVGATGGAYVGGAIGGAIGALGGPFALVTVPAGTAAGSLVGGVVGGFVGDWLGGTAGDWASNQIQESGGREKAIRSLTDHVTSPIADGITDAVDAVRSWQLPEVEIPAIGFSW